jgi:hypothetical protein
MDERFSVAENPHRKGLANIFFDGKNYDLPAISAIDVPEKVTPSATYEFPGGFTARLWSWPEIEARCEQFLKMYKGGELDEDYAK